MGDYNAYVYSINQAIDAGERESAGGKKLTAPSERVPKGKSSGNHDSNKEQRKRRKEIKNLEKKIAELDEDKKAINQKLMESTDADEALKLHASFTEISDELNAAEERWLELTEES